MPLALVLLVSYLPAQPGKSIANDSQYDRKSLYTITQYPQDTIAGIDDVKRILEKATSLNSSAVGYIGKKTEPYMAYEWLCSKATNDELQTFTTNNNPYFRTYAFLALCKRKDADPLPAMLRNLHDTTTMLMIVGCIGSNCKLNGIWLAGIQKHISAAEFRKLSPPVKHRRSSHDFCHFPDED